MRTNFLYSPRSAFTPNVAEQVMAQIEQERRDQRNFRSSMVNFYRRGSAICLLCGMWLDVITHCHASKHGYANRDEFIAAGKVRML
jgi:hypothetical protein